MWQIKYAVSNLVARHPGTLPFFITCPHGGEVTPADVLARDGRSTPAGCDFETNKDLNTREITVGVAQRMLDIFGQPRMSSSRNLPQVHRRQPFAPMRLRGACCREVLRRVPDTLRAFVDEIRAENGGLRSSVRHPWHSRDTRGPGSRLPGHGQRPNRRPTAGGGIRTHYGAHAACAVSWRRPAMWSRRGSGMFPRHRAQRRLHGANLWQL